MMKYRGQGLGGQSTRANFTCDCEGRVGLIASSCLNVLARVPWKNRCRMKIHQDLVKILRSVDHLLHVTLSKQHYKTRKYPVGVNRNKVLEVLWEWDDAVFVLWSHIVRPDTLQGCVCVRSSTFRQGTGKRKENRMEDRPDQLDSSFSVPHFSSH